MSDLERLTRVKKRVAEARRKRDQAKGALREVLRRLKKEFGCKDLASAKKLADRLEREAKKAERAFRRDLDQFEAKWKEFLK